MAARRSFIAPAGHAVSLAVLILLTGCAQVLTPLGSNKYDCNRKEDPNSPYCRSFKAVERGTNGAMPASRFDETLRLAEHDRLTGIAPIDGASKSGELPASSPETPTIAATRPPAPAAARASDLAGDSSVLASLQGRPVRQGPLVQRVWVKRFADNNDMLVGTTFVYKEILPTRWSGISTGATPDSSDRAEGRAPFPHRPSTASAASAPRCSSGKGDGAAGTSCQAGPTEAPSATPQAQVSELDSPLDVRQPGAMPR